MVIELDVTAILLTASYFQAHYMANIGVMGWEVPSLQEIHLKLIFQGSLPYRCVSESKWHTKERKTEWQ